MFFQWKQKISGLITYSVYLFWEERIKKILRRSLCEVNAKAINYKVWGVRCKSKRHKAFAVYKPVFRLNSKPEFLWLSRNGRFDIQTRLSFWRRSTFYSFILISNKVYKKKWQSDLIIFCGLKIELSFAGI